MAEQESRQFAPTEQRRNEARRRGQTSQSHDLTVGISLLVGALVLQSSGSSLGMQLAGTVHHSLQRLLYEEWAVATTQSFGNELLNSIWSLSSAVIVTVMVVGTAVSLLQAGWSISLETLSINWDRLSPLQGWQRIWSRRSATRGVLTTLRATAMSLVVLAILYRDRWLLNGIGYGSLWQAVSVGWTMSIHVATAIGVLLVALGLIDYLYQRWQFEQELMMTREEFKADIRQSEGDPHLKARIKRVQRELGQRLMKEVPRATVVLTNPTHFAVALRYDRATMIAPVVVAKGADFRAHRIIEIAKEHGVPVLERKPLARALYASVKVGQMIPPELYQAIAEILSYLYREQNKATA